MVTRPLRTSGDAPCARGSLLRFRGPPSAKLLRVATEDDDEDIPGIERLLALTDGVVAIALTLLVLQLQVPATTDALLEAILTLPRPCGMHSIPTPRS